MADPRIVVDRLNAGWCHMLTDGPDEHLITFAERIGLRREWIQRPGTDRAHFDLKASKRALALAAGAVEVGPKEIVATIRRKRASGVPHG